MKFTENSKSDENAKDLFAPLPKIHPKHGSPFSHTSHKNLFFKSQYQILKLNGL